MGKHYPSQWKLYDEESRTKKAKKIVAILKDYLKADMKSLRCLDIGCSIGIISAFLADRMGSTIGLDINGEALIIAHQRKRKDNLNFLLGDAIKLPFADASFDIVICSQVYEHVSNSRVLISEIWRVLKAGGLCFFSGPNKLSIIEVHYSLPFLHWLPQPLANLYLRITGRGVEYVERPLTYWQLRRILQSFEIHDYTIEIIADPQRYSCTDEIKENSWIRRIPKWILRRFLFLMPNYNWVLRKPEIAFQSVPPEIYNREYFLTECEGHEEFMITHGRVLIPRLRVALELAKVKARTKVLDIGCGRGEVTFHCAYLGAEAHGINYSAAALQIANSIRAELIDIPTKDVHLYQANACSLPFANRSFDIVFMLDIVEHLYPKELNQTLQEAHRVLKENGKLIVHTMPNIWYYRLGYPFYRFLQRCI
jgi:ubiquinone/menaquinone biosynthesis C-methylase UbiE